MIGEIMANTFKRETGNAIGSSLTTVYTTPASTTTVMIGGVVSNTTVANTNVTVVTGDGTNDINLTGIDTVVPAGAALSFIDGKIVLQAGDTIKVKSSVSGAADVHISIMEIT
jgi:hypothetical protein